MVTVYRLLVVAVWGGASGRVCGSQILIERVAC